MPELNPVVAFLVYVAVAAFAALLAMSAKDEQPSEVSVKTKEDKADGDTRN